MKALSITLLLFSGSILFAQNPNVDIVYLKNGSIIRGTITKIIPDSLISIRTIDQSLFVYRFSEVLKIESEVSPQETSNQKTDYRNPYRLHKRVSLIGLAGSYTATVIGALAVGDETFGTTAIPIVGPWISMSIIENDPEYYYIGGGKGLLIAAGVVQDFFLAYYITSLFLGHSKGSNLSVYPNNTSLGLTLSYRF